MSHTSTTTASVTVAASDLAASFADIFDLIPDTAYYYKVVGISEQGLRLNATLSNATGMMWCIAVRCNVLQSVAVCCSVLQCIAVSGGVFQCIAVCCSVLQCVAECCRVL